MKWASIDFEFSGTKEPSLNLVCCVIRTAETVKRFWVHRSSEWDGKGIDFRKHSEKSKLTKYIDELHDQGYVFLAFAVTAEARSFLALQLDPLKYKWIDLYLEYRQLLNHNHRLMYGKQYKDGKVKTTKPPKNKWEQTEEDKKKSDNDKPSYGLAAACYKLLDVQIDTAFKTKMRDLIISAPESFTDEEQEEIMQYCADDTEYLYPMFIKMIAEYKRLLGKNYNQKRLFKDMKIRAEYACRTAVIEQSGYFVNVEKMRNFSDQVGKILFSCQKDIIDQFPENSPFYKFKRDKGLYTMNQKAIREEIKKWLKTQPRNTRWMMTKGGKSGKKDLSLSLESFTRHFNFTHTYPEGHYYAQMIRYLKLKQSLNGFTPGGKTSIWDSTGSDGKVRPYMGIYTAQSSRSQPKATSFIPLKSAWFRVLIEPPKGTCMVSIDWSSEEFIVAALLSMDPNMLKAYESGDVYLSYGKDCGYIPKNATKESHKKERDNCKPIILGMAYNMSEFGLAKDLTEKFGRVVTPEEALTWINKHKKLYSKFWRWKAKIQRDYKLKKKLTLPDGWSLWGDNDNFRSVGNFPVQGISASIMRKAVALAQDAGLEVNFTLHDALYISCPTEEAKDKAKILAECMDTAFRFYFPIKKIATCRMDCDIWGPGIKEGYSNITYSTSYDEMSMPVHTQELYIDPRGMDQYNQFKKYFDKEEVNYESMQF